MTYKQVYEDSKILHERTRLKYFERNHYSITSLWKRQGDIRKHHVTVNGTGKLYDGEYVPFTTSRGAKTNTKNGTPINHHRGDVTTVRTYSPFMIDLWSKILI